MLLLLQLDNYVFSKGAARDRYFSFPTVSTRVFILLIRKMEKVHYSLFNLITLIGQDPIIEIRTTLYCLTQLISPEHFSLLLYVFLLQFIFLSFQKILQYNNSVFRLILTVIRNTYLYMYLKCTVLTELRPLFYWYFVLTILTQYLPISQ